MSTQSVVFSSSLNSTNRNTIVSKRMPPVVALLLGCIALVGCGGGGGGGAGPARVVSEADFSKCDQHPSVGKAALVDNKVKNEPAEAAFNKPYNKAHLDAVVDASSYSTLEYVQSLGVKLFKVSNADLDNPCPTFAKLPEAGAEEMVAWNDLIARTKKNAPPGEKIALAGLFGDMCGRYPGRARCEPLKLGEPIILLNQRADRFTLVHELMHFNFKSTLVAKPDTIRDSHLAQRMGELRSNIAALTTEYKTQPSEQTLGKLLDAALQATQIGYQFALRSPFEEVAIESLLVDRWSKGELRNVSTDSAYSAVEYMKMSHAVGMVTLNEAQETIKLIETEATTNGWTALVGKADQIKQEIAKVDQYSRAQVGDAEAKYLEIVQQKTQPAEEVPNPAQGQFFFADGADHLSLLEQAEMQAHLESHLRGLDPEGGLESVNEFFKTLQKELQ